MSARGSDSHAGASVAAASPRKALRPGSRFVDFELADHAGNQRRLSQLVGGDPTVLQFYRGWWCPKEQAFFDRLVRLQAEAEVAYSRFVSVSVDPVEVSAAFRAGVGARWTFLSDPERVVQERLGLRETTDTLNHPYVPAVFVLRPDLTIQNAYNGYWFWGRPTEAELIADLRAITREIRPDWEAPTP
jgi:peroxiredoxin